jgi:hypothetical protein
MPVKYGIIVECVIQPNLNNWCLWFVVVGILFPLSEKLKLYPTSVLENTIISVFSGLKDINNFVNQVFSSHKS